MHGLGSHDIKNGKYSELITYVKYFTVKIWNEINRKYKINESQYKVDN